MASTPVLRRYLFAVVWLLVLLACSLQLVERLSTGQAFDTSILALLPDDEQSPLVERALGAMEDRFANQVLFLIGSPHPAAAKLQRETAGFVEHLKASGEFGQVSARINEQLQTQLTRLYRPYRYQLLTKPVRASFQSGDLDTLKDDAYRQLISPVSMPRFASLPEDPLNLLGYWLLQLQPKGGFQMDAGGLTAADDQYQYRVVSATVDGSPFELARQTAILATVDEASRALKNDDEDLVLLRSGLVFHAAAGAKQARSEITTIGVGSLLAIIALLVWHFRAVTPLLLPLMSIGTGLLLALTISIQVFGQVHVITLAFGASLVGVSIDYSLHYLCCQYHLGRAPLRHILPGISLGLGSSVFAYGAQVLTPFPGLQQIAVFSAVGLIGSWLTVVFWFPLLGPAKTTAGRGTSLAQLLIRLARHRRTLAFMLGGLGLAAVAGLTGLTFHDDLRALNTSPPNLIAQEQKIQQLSQSPGSSRFVLVQASDPQQLLEREEDFRHQLDTLVGKHQLQTYQAYSQFVPSIQQQRHDYQLVQRGLADGQLLTDFFATLGAGPVVAKNSLAMLRQHTPHWLKPDGPEAASLRAQFPYLWLGKTADGQVASTIALGGVNDPQVYHHLAELAGRYPGIMFVDRVDDISHLLSRYRTTVSAWVFAAYGLVTLLLAWRYRRSTWQVLMPPLLATLMTFGLLTICGEVLNLFNLLATLLILGIGLDIGIFLQESNRQIHAWEAVTLSAVTSVLAFGLLSLSDTPVLHHFGITVLPGISLTWLIAFVLGSGALAAKCSGHRSARKGVSVF